jgi:hypothetical protein
MPPTTLLRPSFISWPRTRQLRVRGPKSYLLRSLLFVFERLYLSLVTLS